MDKEGENKMGSGAWSKVNTTKSQLYLASTDPTTQWLVTAKPINLGILPLIYLAYYRQSIFRYIGGGGGGASQVPLPLAALSQRRYQGLFSQLAPPRGRVWPRLEPHCLEPYNHYLTQPVKE